MKKLKALGAILLIAALTFAALTYGQYLLQLLFPNYASIGTATSIEAYFYDPPQLWTNNTTIDWGDLDLGTEWTINLTVKNTGNVPLTITIYITNILPDYTVTWTANNTTVNPSHNATAPLTLSVPSTATPGTNIKIFDMTIAGT